MFDNSNTHQNLSGKNMRGARARTNEIEPRPESSTLERQRATQSTCMEGRTLTVESTHSCADINAKVVPENSPRTSKTNVHRALVTNQPQATRVRSRRLVPSPTAESEHQRHQLSQNGTLRCQHAPSQWNYDAHNTEKLHNTVAMTVAAHETKNHMMQTTFAGHQQQPQNPAKPNLVTDPPSNPQWS